jgi:hypothetical protein
MREVVMLWRTLGDALTLGVNEKHLAKFVRQKRHVFGSSDVILKERPTGICAMMEGRQ